MTKEEFITELTGYYGDFSNATVAKQFILNVKKINDNDLPKLLNWFFENIPARFPVDVTTLTKGITACTIFFHEEKKSCPICSKPNGIKANFCCNCGYDFSVPADEYKKNFAPPELVKKTFSNMFVKLEENKRSLYRCSDCTRFMFCHIADNNASHAPCNKFILGSVR